MTRGRTRVADAELGQLSRIWLDLFRRVREGSLTVDEVRDGMLAVTFRRIDSDLDKARKAVAGVAEPRYRAEYFAAIYHASQDPRDLEAARKAVKLEDSTMRAYLSTVVLKNSLDPDDFEYAREAVRNESVHPFNRVAYGAEIAKLSGDREDFAFIRDAASKVGDPEDTAHAYGVIYAVSRDTDDLMAAVAAMNFYVADGQTPYPKYWNRGWCRVVWDCCSAQDFEAARKAAALIGTYGPWHIEASACIAKVTRDPADCEVACARFAEADQHDRLQTWDSLARALLKSHRIETAITIAGLAGKNSSDLALEIVKALTEMGNLEAARHQAQQCPDYWRTRAYSVIYPVSKDPADLEAARNAARHPWDYVEVYTIKMQAQSA